MVEVVEVQSAAGKACVVGERDRIEEREEKRQRQRFFFFSLLLLFSLLFLTETRLVQAVFSPGSLQ